MRLFYKNKRFWVFFLFCIKDYVNADLIPKRNVKKIEIFLINHDSYFSLNFGNFKPQLDLGSIVGTAHYFFFRTNTKSMISDHKSNTKWPFKPRVSVFYTLFGVLSFPKHKKKNISGEKSLYKSLFKDILRSTMVHNIHQVLI